MTSLFADLHSHTTCSDGRLEIPDLVSKAVNVGLQALAITDHDTMEAHRWLRREGMPEDLLVVPGIEFSCNEFGRDVHILGYFLDPDHEELQRYEHEFRQDRESRARSMVSQLQGLGVKVTFDDVMDQAKTAPIGRPHVAAALIERGSVRTIQEAFDKYLDYGKPGYAARSPFHIREAVQLIRDAGGVSVVAHPHRTFTDPTLFLSLIATGLDGIEAYHPSHWPVTREYYRTLATQHRLLITGGSDYHGTRDYDEQNFGTFGVTQDLFEAVHTKHHQRRLHGA